MHFDGEGFFSNMRNSSELPRPKHFSMSQPNSGVIKIALNSFEERGMLRMHLAADGRSPANLKEGNPKI